MEPHPNDRQYSREHTWAKMEGDLVVCGISKYAEDMLNDVVFTDLPRVGVKCEQLKPVGILESIKSVSDLYTPMSGEVAEVNIAVQDDPKLINKDPLGEGWLFKLKASDLNEVKNLMDAAAYDEFLRRGAK